MVTTITSQRASIHIFILRWVLPHLFLNPSSSPCIEGRQAFPCLRDIRIQSKCSWRGIFSLSLKLNQWLHHVSSVASFLPCHYNTPSIAAFPPLHSLHYPHPFPKKQPLSLPKNPNPLWYNKTMNEKESRISKENRMIRKANRELDIENNELKRRVKDLEEENKRLDESVRALKDELFKLMVENGELKRRS